MYILVLDHDTADLDPRVQMVTTSLTGQQNLQSTAEEWTLRSARIVSGTLLLSSFSDLCIADSPDS